MRDRIRVAFVAPSIGMASSQAVQADLLLSAWRDDAEIDAWMAPVNPLLVRQIARADLVHIFSASYTAFLLAPLPAMLVARALGKPVVLNYRSADAPDHLQRSPIARATIRQVDKNIVPSRFLVDVFKGFGIDSSIVPDVVDLQRFRFRERTPLRPRLVSTSTFDALNNVATTIRAFKIVQHRYPDATLTLVGGGVKDADLRALVTQLGLRHVTFAGRVTPQAVARYYEENDIYIQSPNVDNMPARVLEAFASGMPVVSTEAGGVPAVLRHDVHGLLAPLADYERLGHHVLRLLSDPDDARAMARAAFATCDAFTWPKVREQWVRAYRGVLHPAGRTHGADPRGLENATPQRRTS